jgi:hypothetical protein
VEREGNDWGRERDSGVDGWSERLSEREGLRDRGKRERNMGGEKVREKGGKR